MPDDCARWLALAALIATAVVASALLRWARRSSGRAIPNTGWAMLGGALAGILLGPTIFGRIAPDQYERWYAGGIEQRQHRDSLMRTMGADLAAAEHAAVDPAQLEAIRDRHERALFAATESWRAAQWNAQTSQRVVVGTLIALVLLIGGFAPRMPAPKPHQRDILTPLSVGAWSAALPGGLAFLAASAFLGLPWTQAAAIGAALAVGPWVQTKVDRQAADDAEVGGALMMAWAGRVASIMALAVMTFALVAAPPGGGWGALWLAIPLSALALGWIACVPPHALETIRNANDIIFLPALAALLAIKFDVIDHFEFWPMVVVLILCNDGRWLGAFLGAMLPGGRGLMRTARLVIGSMAAGVTQLAFATLAIHCRFIPESWAFALLLGALVMEFTLPTRRRIVQQIEQMEVELDAEK